MNTKHSNKEIFKMINSGEVTPEEGLKLYKQIEREVHISNENEENETVYFKYTWEKSSLDITSNSNEYSKNILIFDNTDEVYNYLKENLSSETNIVLVKQGEGYNKLINGNYTIRKNKKEDYERLIKELKVNNYMPDVVIHMWSEKFINDKEAVKNQLESGIYSVFYLVNSLMKQKVDNTIKFYYYYFTDNEKVQPHNEGVSGFLKTATIENLNFNCRVVEIDNLSNKNNIILKEINYNNELQVKYVGNERFRKNITLMGNEIVNESPLELREKGVYIITGGSGGLGYIFANHLANLKHINLILVGRSEFDLKQSKIVESLKELGAKVTYIKGDVSNSTQVKNIIEQVKAEYKEVHGVIHSAGIIKDSFIARKGIKDIEQVISPKVFGTINLANELKNEMLDFFVTFSSLSGITGNLCQSDYAYANSFMDSYIKLLKKEKWFKKAISINWPLWKDGGMEVDISTKERLLQDFALVPMSNESGLKAFSVGLNLPQEINQLMVFEGNKKGILHTINKLKMGNSYKGINTTQINEEQKIELKKKTEHYLKNIFANEIQLSINKIQLEEPFENYGIDSVMIMNINKELEKDFKNLPKTLLFEYQNIKELLSYFIEKQSNVLLEKFSLNNNSIFTKVTNEKLIKNKGLNNKQPTFTKTMQKAKEPIVTETLEEDIAIIGISGKYPMSDNIYEYWDNLKKGKDCITEIPTNRWDYNRYYNSDKSSIGTSYSKWGGFIDDVDAFDPLFFNISPKEAELMDPQERLFLQTAWHTIEDAGYTRSDLSKKKVGVYVGVMYGHYQLYGAEEYKTINTSYSSIANRVSYCLNLNGTSLAVDTMCSSSLTSVHLACQSIHSGENNLAIAGGVNVSIHPNKYIALSEGRFLSSDGKCRSFGVGGDGYVPGEGVCALLLKPLNKAKEDGDNIYAVIKGSSVNHDGKTNGYTVPNPNAQKELIIEAINKANIEPRTISYIEAHGTGTSLGDPIEITGLVKAFNNYTDDKQYCSIGSAKSNIGHLESAAGIAGISKILLQMKYKLLTPSIHSNKINSNINFKETPFYVQHKLEEWKQPKINNIKYPRRAGISSFGAGGSNAHIIIEEYNNELYEKAYSNEPQIIILSAKNKDRLKDYVKNILHVIKNNEKQHNYKSNDGYITIKTNIQNNICSLLCKIIEVEKEEINLNDSLEDLGLDLVSITSLIEDINEKYKLKMTIGEFLEYDSIELIIQNIVEKTTPEFVVEQTESNNTYINLTDMAYTLQVGREAMEERIALIVNSIEQLRKKLSDYIKGIYGIEGFYEGNIVESNKLDLLTEGRAFEEFINIITKDKEYYKLAKLWVSGVDINWKLLHSNNNLNRISLPTYPFAKERYWIPKERNNIEYKNILGLHPLIESNTSNLKEQKYTTTFTGEEFFFKHHVVAKQKMLPGVAYIEMAREAGELAGEQKVYKIKDINWIKPVIIKDSPEKVNITLYPNSNYVDYEISTLLEDGNKSINSVGKIKYSDSREYHKEVVNIEEIKKRCKVMSSIDCYKDFKDKGFDYGISFQTISKIYTSETEALAHLKLPNSLKNEFNKYTLHPSIFDGALQTVTGIKKYKDKGNSLVPFLVEEVEILDKIKESCFVHAVLLNSDKDNMNIRKYNITITDELGYTLVRIKGLTLRAFAQKTVNSIETTYYKDKWKVVNNDLNKEISGSLLVLCNNKNIIKDLKKYVKGHILLATIGKEFKDLGQHIYEINPNNKDDYKQLVLALKKEEIIPNNILHLWNEEKINKEKMIKQLNVSVYSVFYLIKSLIEERLYNKVNFIYGYESDIYGANPLYAGISGLLKTVTIENPSFICKSVEICSTSINKYIKELVQEFNYNDYSEICYKDDSRYVKEFQEINKDLYNSESIKIKKNGVYIITGGTGGLGMITAKYLAKQFKARIVLTGRSDLNTDKLDKIKQLEELGASVIYIKADISKMEDTTLLITKVKNQYREINGIIHSAGVIKDSFIFRKTKEDMKAVLASKVFGTMYLDEATKNEKLDFFVMYSSAAGKLGNVGQCDYAYGNCFIDNYSKMRDELSKEGKRFGVTLSLNWPLWEAGGMRVDDTTKRLMKENMGLVPLSTESGIKALEDGLKLNTVNMLVLSGYKSKINKMIEQNKEDKNIRTTNSHSLTKDEKSKLYKTTESYLKEVLSKEIKLPATRIASNQSFDKYGLDSIMVLNLNKAFEQSFGDLPKTLLFEYQNINELVEYFIENHQHKLIDIDSIHTIKNVNKNDFVAKSKETIKPHKERFINTRFHKVNNINNDDIAIIGISGKYPMANNLEEFWKNFKQGKDCVTEIPKDRWDYNMYYDPDKNKQGKSYSKWGGFIDDVDKFDPLFFNISPKEAEIMDPQERLFLQVVWHTLEDAGYTRNSLNNKPVGVFVGVMNGHYQLYGVEESMKGNVIALNSSFSSIANRVSYYLNLSGPSIALDTMCSSSITSVHMACQSIRSGDSDMAIAGGVNLSIHPNKYIGLSQNKFISSDGKCKSFGEGADGYVPSEGVGAIFLKPLNKAIEHKDDIYGVIKSSSLNHGGKTNGYTIPNPNAQSNLITKAIEKSKIDPRTISYVEAHGTGTSLGDPIEILGLVKAYKKYTNDKQYCPIGSAKSNIGHLESAAGIAGITKVLLQMKHKKLVPSIHSNVINSNINFKKTPFYVQHKFEEWKQPNIGGDIVPRRAAISAFGAGGANAHIIVEEYTDYLNEKKEHTKEIPVVILLSAKDKNRLKEYVIDFLNYLNKYKNKKNIANFNLENVAYTLQVGREAMDERIAVVASNISQVINSLNYYITNNKHNHENIYVGSKKPMEQTLEKILYRQKGKEFINDLIHNKELNLLAELWVSGIHINWKLMYNDNQLYKISLPTYPFAKETYWVPNMSHSQEFNKYSEVNLTISKPYYENVEHNGKENKDSYKNSFQSHINDNYIEKINKPLVNIEEVIEEKTRYYFMELISSAIKLPIERIGIDTPIEKYGIDSIIIMQLTNELEKIFGQLPKTLFFEYHTVTQLTDYFIESYKDELIELLEIDTFSIVNQSENENIQDLLVDVNSELVNGEIAVASLINKETIDTQSAVELLNDIDNLSNEEVNHLLSKLGEGVIDE
jgi:acyl transferase domain-containing protein/short-subunit dehydrogenase/acyl carrier protein